MVIQCFFSSICLAQKISAEGFTRLSKWERGIKIESRTEKRGFAYLWFYEWHLFDAVTKGEHTPGSWSWKWSIDANGTLDGRFVFSEKWPTSDRDAYAGLMARESNDKQWVMGIAWESYISAQGHNPWECMHLSIRVGPLKQGQTKTIRGKIYLFKGSKEDCLRRFKKDFSTRGDTTAAQQDGPEEPEKSIAELGR